MYTNSTKKLSTAILLVTVQVGWLGGARPRPEVPGVAGACGSRNPAGERPPERLHPNYTCKPGVPVLAGAERCQAQAWNPVLHN